MQLQLWSQLVEVAAAWIVAALVAQRQKTSAAQLCAMRRTTSSTFHVQADAVSSAQTVESRAPAAPPP